MRITDGDTIVVLDADKVQHKIRLQGIDAPDRHQAFGTKSMEHLSDLVAGKTVEVEVDYSRYDRYGRVLGIFLLNGTALLTAALAAGANAMMGQAVEQRGSHLGVPVHTDPLRK